MLYKYPSGKTVSVKPCGGKKPYFSYWHAKRAAKSLNREYGHARVSVYKCDKGNHFHIGNNYIRMKRWR